LTESTEEDDENKSSNSIRLGLGDFIFYSVLVSKAAQYSFTTFAACTLVILSGLGGTLVLLSVYHHALPALPISIFLGVAFYILTRAFVEPWIEAVMSTPLYV
jgi:presenilin 1